MALTDKLTAIADAIRAKKGTTAVFTPEQMAVEIEGIVTGDDLPNAEGFYFGSGDSVENENGITSHGTIKDNSNKMYGGYSFSPVYTIGAVGLRSIVRFGGYKTYVQLWDADGNLLASGEFANPSGQTWSEIKFDKVINLVAGKTYIVSASNTYASTLLRDVVFNEKLGNVSAVYDSEYSSGSDVSAPPFEPVTNGYLIGVADIIIGEAIYESEITEYKILAETLDNMADEIRRISGATVNLSLTEMAEAVAGIQTVGGGGSMLTSSAVGTLPTVYKGTANSEFTLNFESSAVGALGEEN